MAIYKIADPGRTAPTGSECRWIASDNSIDFIFQRKDYTIISAQTWRSGTETRINIAAGDLSPYDNQDIYVEDLPGYYTGTHRITGGGSNWFSIGVAFAGNTIGFVNLLPKYPNYYLDVEVYEYRENKLIANVQGLSNSTGEIRIDVSSAIKSALRLNNEYKYEMVNKREEDWSISFGIRYTEVYYWTGAVYVLGSTTPIEEGKQWYATKAARQIGDEWGQNMRNYEIYEEAVSNEALFLDEGEISTWFLGYPWSLSFIFSERVSGVKYQRVIEELDVNQTLIAGTNQTDYMAEVDQGYTNRLSLRKSGFAYDGVGLDADTHYLRIWIEETDTVTDDDLGGGGSTGGGGTGSGVGGGDASLLADDAVGG